jgi:8-oxo-dGTP pyrophosphatase MutT (NUDIX family)
VIRDFATGNTPALQASAQRWLDAPGEAVPARPAATVMIVQDGADGVEVFMLRRVASMAFAPSTMVFPGGGVDTRDAADLPWAGPGVVSWAARLGADIEATKMLVVAAVREVFEECGVLFASARDDGPLVDVSDSSWALLRQSLIARQASLGAVLHDRALVLRSDLLRAHAHWVTPVFEPKRFDTRFFVAHMPSHQSADGETSEADTAGWFRPEQVLSDYAAGRAVLLPPTLVCLEQLAAAGSAEAFFELEPVIRRLEPVLAHDADGRLVVRVDFEGTPARGSNDHRHS